MSKVIGSRMWQKNLQYYVSDLLGNGHPRKDPCDWGYTTDINKAIHLTPYWVRRFRKDCERVNSKAMFTVLD